MFKDNDKITLKTSDSYYLLSNGQTILLSQTKTVPGYKSDWNVTFDDNLGFKLFVKENNADYYLNGNTEQSILSMTSDSTFTGTNWCASSVTNQSTNNAILLIALTQNGNSRFAHGVGGKKELSLYQWPQYNPPATNGCVWTYSIQN